MDIGHPLTIYGFGSFFSNGLESEDVDLLIIHRDLSIDSCELGIGCKNILQNSIAQAHITILSHDEETIMNIIDRCNAQAIGTVSHLRIAEDSQNIANRINAHFKGAWSDHA